MKRTLFLSLAFLCFWLGMAQSQFTNSTFEVEMHDLEYYNPEQLHDYIIFVGNGPRTSHNTLHTQKYPKYLDLRYENLVWSINETVKSAFNDVNRLQCTHQRFNEAADLQLTGVITNLSISTQEKVNERKDKNGKKYKELEIIYNGNISLALTLTDLQSGHFNTHKFYRESFNHSAATKPDEIIHDLIKGLQYDITRYYNEQYPLHAEIIELAEVTKGKVKQLYLNLGKNHNIQKNQHFDLFTLGEVAGHVTETKIGRVKVDEVRGSDISLCDVQKGSREIKEAVDHNAKIIAISSY